MFTMSFKGNILPIKVKEIKGRGLAGLIPTIIKNSDGSEKKVVNVKELDEPLQVIFTLPSRNKEDLQDKVTELNEMLYSEDFEPIVFSDEPNIHYYGILSGKDWTEGEFRGEGTIIFEKQPYKEGLEIVSSNLTDYNNPGSVPVYPIIEITINEAVNNFKITHEQTGGFISVIWGFVAGDKVVIDLIKRKLLINGNTRMVAYNWSNVPFKYIPGVNKITFDKEFNKTVDIKIKPKWR